MMSRCYHKQSQAYNRYGGRGIFVCDRWHDVRNFIEDMDPRPEGLSLERKDNDGSYSKENCIWVTPKQQGRNKRNSRMLKFDGQIKSAAEWDLCVSYNCFHQKLTYWKNRPIEEVFLFFINKLNDSNLVVANDSCVV